MLKVVATAQFGPAADAFKKISDEILGDIAEISIIPCDTEDKIIEACKDADAVIAGLDPYTEKVFASLEKLKMVSGVAIGYNTFDVEAAKKYGVAVSNNPRYCVNEVADHASALILALVRKLLDYNKQVKTEYVWAPQSQRGKIKRVCVQTLGLIGFGNIARLVAKRMQGFGCEIIAYDPYIKQDFADQFNVKMVSIDELYEKSDIISVHALLNPQTEGMIGKEAFKKMAAKKPIFVNCARGGLIDEDALLDAIKTEKISAVGLDVFISEKPDLADSPFTKLGDNVIITPHAAYFSDNAQYEMLVFSCENLRNFFTGNGDKVPIVNGIKEPKA
ncbi:MAG: C-terminal binding protein [Eubacteriaceae bacterium]